jgi:glycosyltransferase involved in cell wall biosynthesis
MLDRTAGAVLSPSAGVRRDPVMTSDRPLRIAHFTLGRCNPDSANGVDKTTYHLARTQAALGHEVAVFSLTDKPGFPIPGVEVRTVAPVSVPVPFSSRRLRDLFGARAPWNVPRRLVSEIVAWRPDVLHLHYVHIPPNVFLARRLSPGIPYCVTINGGLAPAAQRRRRWLKRLFRALFEREYLERAAFLHAISDQDLRGLESYGVANTTVLAPNGIDGDSLGGASGESGPRLLDERLAGKRVFLYLGRLDPQQKGLDLLLHAFAACAEDRAVLVLAGPDWRGGQRQLESLATSLGIRHRIVFAGPRFGTDKL